MPLPLFAWWSVLRGAVEMNPYGGIDSDADGMSDDYENLYGLNPGDASDAGIDSDGDGLTNLQEFQAGTDPFDRTSDFRITSVLRSGNDVVVGFGLAIKGKSYRLERKDNLIDPLQTWSPINGVADFVPGVTGAGQITDPNGAAPARHFYRVRVLP